MHEAPFFTSTAHIYVIGQSTFNNGFLYSTGMKVEPKGEENLLLQESVSPMAMAKEEEGFKKGHSRSDSGHVLVTGIKPCAYGNFSPITSSDEEEDSKVLTQRSQGHSVNKGHVDTTYVDISNKSSHGVNLPGIENSREDEYKQKYDLLYENNGNKKTVITSVALDISKLCIEKIPRAETTVDSNDLELANDSNMKADKTSESVSLNSQNVNESPGCSAFKNCLDKGIKFPEEDIVDFTDAIRGKFADIVRSKVDVMEICDYLYQYKIMNMTKYEEFFELSHCRSFSPKNLKRKLMLFMSKRLPKQKIESAVAYAGCLSIFSDVFRSLGTEGN